MNNKIFLIISAAVVLSLGTFLLVNNLKDDKEDTATSQATVTEPKSAQNETSQPTDQTPAPELEKINLVSVEGSTGSGTATRTTQGKYIHSVTAELADPATGKFYEGWIVVNSSNFISTGELVKESEGQWSLTYSSNEDLNSYISVVITEETSANGLDNMPEDHILEGSF